MKPFQTQSGSWEPGFGGESQDTESMTHERKSRQAEPHQHVQRKACPRTQTSLSREKARASQRGTRTCLQRVGSRHSAAEHTVQSAKDRHRLFTEGDTEAHAGEDAMPPSSGRAECRPRPRGCAGRQHGPGTPVTPPAAGERVGKRIPRVPVGGGNGKRRFLKLNLRHGYKSATVLWACVPET